MNQAHNPSGESNLGQRINRLSIVPKSRRIPKMTDKLLYLRPCKDCQPHKELNGKVKYIIGN